METIRLQTTVAVDGRIRLEVPCSLPPGPAEVVVVITPAGVPSSKLSWHDIVGVGKEIWEGENAQDYVNRLRDEWEK